MSSGADVADKLKTYIQRMAANSTNSAGNAGQANTITTANSPYQVGTVTTGTTTGIVNYPTYQSSQQLNQLLGQYTQAYVPPPPTLPIKLNIRELVALLRALEKDEELKGIVQKFQPFIGVEI